MRRIRVYFICRLRLVSHLTAAVLLAIILFPELAAAQPGPNNSSATPSATAWPSVTPIPTSAIVNEAEATDARLREIRAEINRQSPSESLELELPTLRDQIDELEPRALEVLDQGPSLDDLRQLDREWQPLSRRTEPWRTELRSQLTALEKLIAELDSTSQKWRSASEALSNGSGDLGVSRSTIPPEILRKVNDVLSAVDQSRGVAAESQARLLSLQARNSELELRVAAVRDAIRAARANSLRNLASRTEAPVWVDRSISFTGLWEAALITLNEQAQAMRAYAFQRSERFLLQGLIFILVTAALYWSRRKIVPWVKKEPKLERSAQIFALPLVTGLIVALIAGYWLHQQAPPMLRSVTGAASLIPVVVLLRRLVEKPLFGILYALVLIYFIDLFRGLLIDQAVTARLVFMAEMLGAILFLIYYIVARGVSEKVAASEFRVFSTVRRLIPFALIVFAVAFLASALGFVDLANIVGNGVLGSVAVGLIVYTAVQIVRGLIIIALRIPFLARTSAVRHNRALIRERSVRFISIIAVMVWLLITLNLFSVRQSVFAFARALLSWSVMLGTVELSLGAVLLFIFTIWIAVQVSRMLRFVLEEDVYPRVDLGGGVSYAVSTMLHYTILVIAFLIAVAALGIDFTKFAIIGGAVGIGIGFGLQNIINNFVSGLILLFERPVKVGDTVQLGEHTGALSQIGLRASVLRKVDGSDVIVPNSRLISEEVVNWTMSDEKRRIDIPVGVAYGTDPEVVLQLLAKIPSDYDQVLTDPAPRAIFIGMGESSLDFELRVWTGHTEGWVRLRSDLVGGVYKALTAAGIEIPFPQTDIHIRREVGDTR